MWHIEEFQFFLCSAFILYTLKHNPDTINSQVNMEMNFSFKQDKQANKQKKTEVLKNNKLASSKLR